MDFDVVVVGSGFGGAIVGCRLAEAGMRVLILEKGRRWEKGQYPRSPADAWLFDEHNSTRESGLFDFRRFQNISVLSGVGVGGGSLVYADVATVPPAKTFSQGWPLEITLQELKPYFEKVNRFQNIQTMPTRTKTAREELMERIATKLGEPARFRRMDLAISFDPEFNGPCLEEASQPFVNAHGMAQGTCAYLGECQIGCPVEAKNTLALSYIPWAERHGADVRPLHQVTNIEELSGGYRVHFRHLGVENTAESASVSSERVVIAAGSLGSTELLLKCRNVTKGLPRVSSAVGKGWNNNGFLVLPTFFDHADVRPSFGPTITSSLDFLDDPGDGSAFLLEDGGFPRLLQDYLESWVLLRCPTNEVERMAQLTAQQCFSKLKTERPGEARSQDREIRADLNILDQVRKDARPLMPFLVQGMDTNRGRIELRNRRTELAWEPRDSYPFIDGVLRTLDRITKAVPGSVVLPFSNSPIKHMVTLHPLGGCNMADTPSTGVVNHLGEVSGHKNCYVVDGSIVPGPIGVNPSHTIAALAERIASEIISQRKSTDHLLGTTFFVPEELNANAFPSPTSPSDVGAAIPQNRTHDAPETVSFPSSEDGTRTLVRVFYATDRMQISSGKETRFGRGRSRNGVLTYGQCEVSIPKAHHKIGGFETPSILRLEFWPNPKKHIVLSETLSLPEQSFFRLIRESTARSVSEDAFVFVHGYNVSFEDAARRTGQIAFDLHFIGAPIFYSWPSNGRIKDYLKDENNITWSTPHFQIFLEQLAHNCGAKKIHIIAHSMGNRAVCDALKVLSYDRRSQLKFNHLLLAAPDIDADTFRELSATLQRLCARVTLYESSGDKALQVSKKIYGNPRAGEPILVVKGMDTIDASAIDTDFLGHSYFSDSWPLLSDFHAIIFDDKAPSDRFGLTPVDHLDGRYYAFKR